MKNKSILMGALAGVMAVGLFGCTPEARDKYDSAGDSIGSGVNKTGDAIQTDAAKSTEAAAEAAKNTGEAVENAAKNTGEAVKNAAENTAEAAKNATKEAAEKGDDAQTTFAVKNAIIGADNLDASELNVDTADKIVHLRGNVPSESAKKRAETLAKGIVGNKYTIKNELKVVPKM